MNFPDLFPYRSHRTAPRFSTVLAVVGVAFLAACTEQPTPLEPRLAPTQAQPLLVSAPGPFTAVGAGLLHSCAIRTDGAAECWGLNDEGQAPPTKTPAVGSFVAISGGYPNTCALRTDGVVECWGFNGYGAAPATKSPAAGSFVALSANSQHACAVRSDGIVECWGMNDYGQAPATRSPAVGSFVAVGGGFAHTCAVRADGAAECWGLDDYGQAPATKSATAGGFVAISAGSYHTCALRTDGLVECWGVNDDGQAPATKVAASGSFVAVSADGFHTCAIRTDGVAECWGYNGDGAAPATKSAAVGSFTGVESGFIHTCAVRADGVVECWGANNYGQAPATRGVAPTPIHVLPTATFAAPASVVAGQPIGLALTNAQVPGYPQATTFTYAFDCGGAGYGAASGTATQSCATATAGSRTVRGKVIDQDGDSAEYSATVSVTPVAQMIAFTSQPPNPALVNGTYAVSATGGASGNAVVFSSLAPNVCTVSGSTVSVVAAGSCTIAANQAGNATYAPAPQVTQSFTVAQQSQAITFTSQPPSPALVHGTYVVSATGGASGNPVVFTSLTPNVCTASGSAVTLNAIGPCTIAANQAGSASFTPAPQVTQSFGVAYGFVGFSQPVDNLPTVNSANAGQAIPLKWRLVDANGTPVTTLTAADVTVTVVTLSCNIGTTPDLLEEYATGFSGLQNLGNGEYQFNWKTPKSYAKSCKTMQLDLGEGITHQAAFQFK